MRAVLHRKKMYLKIDHIQKEQRREGGSMLKVHSLKHHFKVCEHFL